LLDVSPSHTNISCDRTQLLFGIAREYSHHIHGPSDESISPGMPPSSSVSPCTISLTSSDAGPPPPKKLSTDGSTDDELSSVDRNGECTPSTSSITRPALRPGGADPFIFRFVLDLSIKTCPCLSFSLALGRPLQQLSTNPIFRSY
jgi:hypothetical protein